MNENALRVETTLPSLQELQLGCQEANSYVKTSQQLRQSGYIEDAEDCLHKAIEVYQSTIEKLFSVLDSNKLIQLYSQPISSPLETVQKGEEQRKDAAKLLNDGKQLEGEGKLEEAINCYHQAINWNPNLPWIYHSLGDVLAKQGKLDEAINCYCECIHLSPQTPWSYHALGDILVKKGRSNEAIAFYQWALRIDPNLYWTHNALGGLYEHSGKLEQAEYHYQKAIAIDPNIEQAKIGLERLKK